MRVLLGCLLAICLPGLVWANCGGIDVRPTLTDAQRAEVATRMADHPFPEGNHWTATKAGRKIHLIGTMHIDDPLMDDLAARLAPVIKAADALLVEATKEDQKALERELASNPELAFLSGKTLIDLMPAEDWETLSAAAAARGIPSFMAAKFQPWYLSLMLSMSPCEIREMQKGAEGLDKRLIDVAEAAGVPTASLEPYTTVFELFGRAPLEEQIAMLQVGILPDDVSENATATLKIQYFEEQHMSALETSRVVARDAVDISEEEFDAFFDAFIDLLVRERNEAWMAPIAEAEGDLIVVASGALHLGGKHGLLNLLQAQGYTLERQPF